MMVHDKLKTIMGYPQPWEGHKPDKTHTKIPLQEIYSLIRRIDMHVIAIFMGCLVSLTDA